MNYIKCCGFCCADDIAVAVAYGASAIGFVCYEKSRRFVTTQTIAHLCRTIPQTVDKVAVVINPTPNAIDTLADTGINVLQLHGDEMPLLAEQIRQKYPHLTVSKALPADEQLLGNVARFQKTVDYFLIDTPTLQYGGSGVSFDWRCLQELANLDIRYLIAGGLDAQKIAFLQKQPLGQWGYDVSSTLETYGVKDQNKIKALLTMVRNKEQK